MEKNKPAILYREGTTQSERYPEALSPEYVKIDERSLIDLVKQSAEFAKFVNYYSSSNTIDGDWTGLFHEIYDYEKKQVRFNSIKELENKGTVSPHVALFLSFLRIFSIAQDNLNSLKEKHLDLYFREILGIEPRQAQPDSVPLFFEPNKTVSQAIIPSGTRFEAGKDAIGKPLLYTTKNDLVVNHGKIGALKGFHRNSNGLYLTNDMLNHCMNNDSKELFLGVHCNKDVTVGVAIASSLLNLPDGERTITLEIRNAKGFNVDCIEAKYTSEKGWEEGTVTPLLIKNNRNEKELYGINVIIHNNQPSVTGYDENIHYLGINAGYPVIRLLYKRQTVSGIDSWTTNNIEFYGIRIDVKGSKALKISNKYGVLNINKPFMPFGMQPNKGEQMEVYNPSIFNKFLKSYNLYIDGKKINEKNESSSFLCSSPPVPATGDMLYDYVYVTLNSELGHATYAEKYAIAAIKLSKAKTEDEEKKIEFPDKPHIPQIKDFSIDYTMHSGETANNSEYVLYHIHPFGWEKPVTYKNLFPAIIDGEGALFFGVSGLNKPGILSLYLRLSEYGMNFEKVIDEKNSPVWYFLDGNSWKKFAKEDIVLNSTGGFSRSGSLYFNVGTDAFKEHTIMPNNMVWLMLLFEKDNDAYPVLDGVKTQVVEAVFENKGNDLSHLEKGLPAGIITKPSTLIPGICAVKQTYPSSGGRAPETTRSYHTRVSEQLRHKGRAWNIWDYERLILEQFPEIFKVKCVPYSDIDAGYAPGNVLIILLPDCDIIPQKNILCPIVTQALIGEITEYISSRCSPFISARVTNPVYERISVTCNVAFKQGCDADFYSDKLNEELKRFLSSWIDDKNNLVFNKKLTNAQIIYFIEKRPYISHLLSMKITINNRQFIEDKEVIQASSPNIILTSADKHNININKDVRKRNIL